MATRDLVLHSGGQTGVDRAALDAAQSAGVPTGGWCPQGRRAEDGPIPPHYPLRETPTADYTERTRRNVRDTDATLVLTRGDPDEGTTLTIETARVLGKPLRIVDLDADPGAESVAGWVRTHGVHVLNVAGPRESSAPGIYAAAQAFVARVLAALGY